MATRIPSSGTPLPAPPLPPRSPASTHPNPPDELPPGSPLAGLHQHAGPLPRLGSSAPTALLHALSGGQPMGQALSVPMVPAADVAPALRRTRIGPEDTT